MTPILEKVRKLLALARKNNNANEAAAAAATAERLIQEHRLSEAEIEADGDAPGPGAVGSPQDIDEMGPRLEHWKSHLLSGLCELHGCATFHRRSRRRVWLCVVGTASDVEAVRYLYAWLVGEVDRLADEHGTGKGRTWRNNYRTGCVVGIYDAMDAAQQKARAAATSTALALVDERLTRAQAGLPTGLKSAPKSRTESDPDAFVRGREDGHALHERTRAHGGRTLTG